MEQMGLVKLKNLNGVMGEALGFYTQPIWDIPMVFHSKGTRWCLSSYKLVYKPINYRYITYKP